MPITEIVITIPDISKLNILVPVGLASFSVVGQSPCPQVLDNEYSL